MRIPYQRYWRLQGINRRLCRWDPHLAVPLVIFARLAAGEAITSWEQPGPPGARMRRVLARLGSAAAVVAARLSAAGRCVLRRAALVCAAVRFPLSGGARKAMSAPTFPRGASDPGRSA